MSPLSASQELGHRFWSICWLFYAALIEFREQHGAYEEKVMRLARETGVHRDVLRLRPAELAGLLDFKSLEDLRDGYIHELKDLCHEVFRQPESTDPLDRYVSDIFHEISILKEEHYTLKTYAPAYEEESQETELQYILDEAHSMFPYKMRQVLYLFGKAEERMEEHLRRSRGERVFIRSLYWARTGFVQRAYPDGLRAFYRIMYPCGPLEGFHRVAGSFYDSGFFAEALESYSRALEEAAPSRAALAERDRDPDFAGWAPSSSEEVDRLIAEANDRLAELKARR